MRGIYLCCGRARHFDYNIDYQDIDPHYGNITGDALSVDLTPYDFVIATPPCNNVHLVVERWLKELFSDELF